MQPLSSETLTFEGPGHPKFNKKLIKKRTKKHACKKVSQREVKVPKLRSQGWPQGSRMRPWSLQNSSKIRTWTPLGAKRWPHRPQRYPPDPKFNENHQKYDQHLTENVQKPFAKQCKLTFKNVVGMHLGFHYYILAAYFAKLNSKVK